MVAGRPTKLSSNAEHRILQAVRAGNYIETAAAYAGINKSTLYDWMKRGSREEDRIQKGEVPDEDEQIYVEFVGKIEQALAESEVRDVTVILNAGTEHWQASAWRLERRFPNRWSKTDKTEITGKDGSPIQIEDVKEKLRMELNEIRKRKIESESIEEHQDGVD